MFLGHPFRSGNKEELTWPTHTDRTTNKSTRAHLNDALISMDHIWMAQNKFIHSGPFSDTQLCLHAIIAINVSVTAHLKAWKDSQTFGVHWIPPPIGFLKVNFDAAIHHLFCVASTVLSDHNG